MSVFAGLVAGVGMAFIGRISSVQAQGGFDMGPIPGVNITCLQQSPSAGTRPRNPLVDGSWRQFRRDRQLTGRSPLVGSTTCPEVLWSLDLGARKTWLALTPGGGTSTTTLPIAGSTGDYWQTNIAFEVQGTQIDLDGDGSRNGSGPTTGRAYGWFGAFDVDGDGRREFVILGDFEMFISVIGWQGGQLVELWDRQIEAGTFLNTAIHHPGVNPVQDVDGDGRPEIVSSVFNDDGDERWHVVGLDARTGAVKFDLVDRYLSGFGDLNGNGGAELLLTGTAGSVVPEYGSTSVVSYQGGQWSTLWSSPTQGFEVTDVPGFPDHVNSRTTHYRRTAFVRSGWTGGAPIFITRETTTPPHVRLRLFQWSGSALVEIGTLTGPRLAVDALPLMAPERGILVRAMAQSSAESALSLSQLTARVEFGGRSRSGDGDRAAFKTLLTSSTVGTLTAGARPAIVTQDFLLNVRAFDINPATNQPRALWSAPGRGMTSGDFLRPVSTINGFGSVLLADIRGDGSQTVVAAGRNALGQAVLRAFNSDGSTLWEKAFPVPGAPPIWNDPGITHWLAGHFTTTAREDIMVSLRTAKSASDRLYLLNGATGQQIWERSNGGNYSCTAAYGAGGTNMPVLDWDQDGLDDVLNTLSSLFVVYKGNTGAVLLNRWATGWCTSPLQLFSQGFLEGAVGIVPTSWATARGGFCTERTKRRWRCSISGARRTGTRRSTSA